MHNIDLVIVAAGSGRRLGSDLPKALTHIDGMPLISKTLSKIAHAFKNVYVIVKDDEEGSDDYHTQYWNGWHDEFTGFSKLGYYERDNIKLIPITSGRGDGHALLQGLKEIPGSGIKSGTDEVLVMWGDVYINNSYIVSELVSKPCSVSGVMPVLLEEDPYVTIITERPDENGLRAVRSADFKKYGETHDFGFHDQSIFKFNRSDLLHALENLDRSLDKNGKYITKNGELSTLHVFHHFYNMSKVNSVCKPMMAYPISEDLKTYSFNTPYELEQMKKELGL